MKKIYFSSLILSFLTAFSAFAQPQKVKDLSGNEKLFTGFQNNVFFVEGNTLYKGGTEDVENIASPDFPIVNRGYPYDVIGPRGSVVTFQLPTTSNRLFFVTEESEETVHLWISDGTADGTHQAGTFKDIKFYTEFKGELYFIADHEDSGLEIWKSDSEGNVLQITDINPGAEDSFYSELGSWEEYHLEAAEDYLYFSATNAETGFELYRTDGTPGGAELIKDIVEGPEGSRPREIRYVNNKIYFAVTDFENETETLWETDGTEEGTNLAWDLGEHNLIRYAGVHNHYLMLQTGSFVSQLPVYLTSYNSITGDTSLLGNQLTYPKENWISLGEEMFFPDYADYYTRSLWKTDGTSEGTAAFYGSIEDNHRVNDYEKAGNYIFLPLSDTETYTGAPEEPGFKELTRTDLTNEGTVFVKDLYPNLDLDLDYSGNYTATNGLLYFTVNMIPEAFSNIPGTPALYVYDVFAENNPQPAITSFSPSSGHEGTEVSILGENFEGATSVEFNGVAAASFEVLNPTRIVATVAEGTSTGPITITTPNGAVTSEANFVVEERGIANLTIPGTEEVICLANEENLVLDFETIGSFPEGTEFTAYMTGYQGLFPEHELGSTTAGEGTSISLNFPERVVREGSHQIFVHAYLGDDTLAESLGLSKEIYTKIDPDVNSIRSIVAGGVNYNAGETLVIDHDNNIEVNLEQGVEGIQYKLVHVDSETSVTDWQTSAIAPADLTLFVENPQEGEYRVFARTISISQEVTCQDSVRLPNHYFIVSFEEQIPPVITSFRPDMAAEGIEITITGENFSGVTEILFNGVSATEFSVENDTEISVVVPEGAESGPITVITAAGTAISEDDFIVLHRPVIASFNPERGYYGDEVTITGENFEHIHWVRFDGEYAEYEVINSNTIIAIVPEGIGTGDIAIANVHLIGYSEKEFEIVRPDEDPTSVFSSVDNSSILKQNYPNPFANETTISFVLPESQNITLEVVDVNGEVVAVPASGSYSAGKHDVQLNISLPEGIYYYRLSAESFTESRKMIKF